MWQRKSRDPRNVPCGTADPTWAERDFSPSTTTLIFRLVRKLAIHVCSRVLIPYASNVCSSFLWGTLSKALLKSRITTSLQIFAPLLTLSGLVEEV